MRLYHFLPANFALDNLVNSRIKIGEIDNLNDPFELWCPDMGDAKLRRAFRLWRNDMAKRNGMICFSASWRNPLLWSHYADRHRGICLGFDVDDRFIYAVTYQEARTQFRLPLSQLYHRYLLFTKFSGWSYEEEWRMWIDLDHKTRSREGLLFLPFDQNLKPAEVIIGPLCSLRRRDIERQTKHLPNLEIFIARLAFKTFWVVADRRSRSKANAPERKRKPTGRVSSQ